MANLRHVCCSSLCESLKALKGLLSLASIISSETGLHLPRGGIKASNDFGFIFLIFRLDKILNVEEYCH